LTMANERNTSDAIEILDRRIGDDPEMRRKIEDARLQADVAQQICDARERAGLSQQALADMVGTTQSVISRIEDADYRGHSLTTLRRVAAARGCRLRVELVRIDEPVPVRDGRAVRAKRSGRSCSKAVKSRARKRTARKTRR